MSSDGGPPPYLVRTLGAGPARTLADHLSDPLDPPSPARTAPRAATPPAVTPSASFLRRTRGGTSRRTLADHLHPPPDPAPAPASAPVAAVGEARESERRTVLDADDPVVTLRAADLPRSGRLLVTLEWDRPRTRGGVQSSTDVHLGCLWQTTTDHSGLVQSRGGLLSAPGFGARQVLRLGPRSEDEGEPLTVDLATVDSMARLLLFAHGQRTPPPWQALGVRLTLHLPSGARVLMWPSAPSEPATSIAIASVHVVDGDLVVRREDEPIAGPAREVALAYGWDLDWSADGTVPRT